MGESRREHYGRGSHWQEKTNARGPSSHTFDDILVVKRLEDLHLIFELLNFVFLEDEFVCPEK